MPSRITFAIGDLMSEIKALQPTNETPAVVLVLDEPAYKAVVGEIGNFYGDALKPDPTYTDGVAVRFAGMQIVMLPPDPIEVGTDEIHHA